MRKCVFVIGPESSGSMLIAKICSAALDIQKYGDWNGVGWSDKGYHKVCHRSLPYGIPPRYPDIEKWISENEKNYDIYFILTIRDITVSELSRMERFSKPLNQVQDESARAREIMCGVIQCGNKYFIWSYEAFMFLGKEYLDLLYEFLGVNSVFIPFLNDGNRKRIIDKKLGYTPSFMFLAKVFKYFHVLTRRFPCV